MAKSLVQYLIIKIMAITTIEKYNDSCTNGSHKQIEMW